MNDKNERTENFKQYVAAYATHYKTKEPQKAIELYRAVISAHPNTQEAEFSREQILNIVHDVVPKQDLFDAQVSLALTYLENGKTPVVKPPPVPPAAP